VECGGGAQASLHPRPSLFHLQLIALRPGLRAIPGDPGHGQVYESMPAILGKSLSSRWPASDQAADTRRRNLHPAAFPTNSTTLTCETQPMLKLHAGVSRKVGLPGYSSASASCTIEAELDSSLLQDRAGFQLVVQRAYQSCEQAVQDQIARLTQDGRPGEAVSSQASQPGIPPEPVVEIRTSPAIQGAQIMTNRAVFRDQPSPRPATASQVRAIRAICSRRKIDLVELLRDRFGVQTADELGIRQASNLIDEIKSDEATPNAVPSPTPSPGTNGHANGNGTYAVNGGAR